MFPTLDIDGKPADVADFKFTSCLCKESNLVATLGQPIAPPDDEADVDLKFGDSTYPFRIEDFSIRPQGDSPPRVWLQDPVCAAQPFCLSVYSSRDGVSFGDTIEDRLKTVSLRLDAPAEVYRTFPTITVDCRLPQLLDDVCARNGWFWRHGGDRVVEIGTLTGDDQPLTAVAASRIKRGFALEQVGPPFPGVGDRVSFGEFQGVVKSIVIDWVHGSPANCSLSAFLGDAPPLDRCLPDGTCFRPCVVQELGSPLLVDVEWEDGSTTPALGRLMLRRGGKYREQLPVDVGDRLIIALETNGVSAELPRIYTFDEDEPCEIFRIEANEYEVTAVEIRHRADARAEISTNQLVMGIDTEVNVDER